MSLLKLFGDAKFYHVLDRIDAELAEVTRRARCRDCGGVLHSARYPRKPRGGPTDLPTNYEQRASYCCAVDGCRKRTTPPSTRFLGRRVYLGAVVVLASAMQHGINARRAKQLRKAFGASRQTLERWRTWWREAFTESAFWKAAKAAFSTPVAEDVPGSLLERFAGDDIERLTALLRFVSPMSAPADYVPDRRR